MLAPFPWRSHASPLSILSAPVTRFYKAAAWLPHSEGNHTAPTPLECASHACALQGGVLSQANLQYPPHQSKHDAGQAPVTILPGSFLLWSPCKGDLLPNIGLLIPADGLRTRELSVRQRALKTVNA